MFLYTGGWSINWSFDRKLALSQFVFSFDHQVSKDRIIVGNRRIRLVQPEWRQNWEQVTYYILLYSAWCEHLLILHAEIFQRNSLCKLNVTHRLVWDKAYAGVALQASSHVISGNGVVSRLSLWNNNCLGPFDSCIYWHSPKTDVVHDRFRGPTIPPIFQQESVCCLDLEN